MKTKAEIPAVCDRACRASAAVQEARRQLFGFGWRLA